MNTEPVDHLLYLHGFRSTPQSTKARRMARYVAEHRPEVNFWCPQLAASPKQAMAEVFERVLAWPSARSAVIGSSLGGFYATAVAERLGCRAVLLNPAVHPERDLAGYVGETTTWQTDEPFEFRPEYVDELRDLVVEGLTRPERYYAVIAKGDEVLSWREMVGRYPGVHVELIDGGDHALSDFDRHLPEIARFLGWSTEDGDAKAG